ncbi:MAG: hypothetical protein U1E45_13095 [Geminicoccaceae bacterium]
MTVSPRVAVGVAAAALLVAGPASAHHNDWAAPLVGGALGGYALGTIVANSNNQPKTVYETPAPTYYANPAPVYYTPPPAAVPSASTIEAQLAQLDKLAAAGYITPQEYKTRRQALLNELSPP